MNATLPTARESTRKRAGEAERGARRKSVFARALAK
jgi:hypothetical protein